MNKFILIISVFLLSSCSSGNANKTDEVESPANEILLPVDHQFSKDNCLTNNDNCAKVDLSWFTYEGGNVAEKINQAILAKFLEELGSYSGKDSSAHMNDFESLANSFLNENTKFRTEFPKSNANWFIDMQCQEIFQDSNYLSVEFAFSAYTGGAHGSDNIYFLVFDSNNGKTLQIEDVVPNINDLKIIAEEKFKALKGFETNASLNEAGYFFEEGQFPVEGNFALKNDTLILMYNPYDIAAYSEGRTVLKIAITELQQAL